MGADIQKQSTFNVQDYTPILSQYRLKHCGPNYYVWEDNLQNQSLIQFPINIVSQTVLKQNLDVFLFRHRHPILVSSLYFRNNESSGKASVFYQRVFTNLGRIKDIPFQDSLQFYYICLKGFQLLYKKFGFFQIEQDMIHITVNKKVKIWCHKDISKLKPKQIKLEIMNNRRQEEMVKKIIRIIQQNSDNLSAHYPIAAILFQQASNSFGSALLKLRQICQQNILLIPTKLKCLDIISQGQVGHLLDQYGQVKQSAISPQNVNKISKTNIQTKEPVKAENNLISYGISQINNKTKKHSKGLQVSHSLQKFNHKSGVHIRRNPFVDSPIKDIKDLNRTKQKQNQLVSSIPLPIPHKPLNNYVVVANIQRPPSQKIPQINPHSMICPVNYSNYNYNPVKISNGIRQSIDNRNSQRIVRKPSFDAFTSHPMNKPGSQYKVVVNFANRPPSPSHNSSFNHNSQNIFTLPAPAIMNNNLLNPLLPFPFLPSQTQNEISHSKQVQKSLNINLSTNRDLNSVRVQNDTNKNIQISSNSEKENMSFPLPFQHSDKIMHRDTFISNLSENQKSEPLKDYSNFKSRFQQYKKNFSFENTNNVKKNDLNRKESENYSAKNFAKVPEQKLVKKPFFVGILNTDTVHSYADQNQFSVDKRKIQSNKSLKNDANQFPSVTDVSDNVSYFPNKQKQENIWRQESLVIKHDVNFAEIKLPESKKYQPEIDKQIWADMLKVKNKYKYATPEQKI